MSGYLFPNTFQYVVNTLSIIESYCICARHCRTHTDLCGGEGVAIAIARHLASATDIMVADGLPPDDRHSVVEGVDVVIDGTHVNLQLELVRTDNTRN